MRPVSSVFNLCAAHYSFVTEFVYAIELQLPSVFLCEKGVARGEDCRKELQAGESFILFGLNHLGSRRETVKSPCVNTDTSALEYFFICKSFQADSDPLSSLCANTPVNEFVSRNAHRCFKPELSPAILCVRNPTPSLVHSS